MDNLIASLDLDRSLKLLTVPEMREICRSINLEATENNHILRHRIRRYIAAKKDHDEALRAQFPGVPAEILEVF